MKLATWTVSNSVQLANFIVSPSPGAGIQHLKIMENLFICALYKKNSLWAHSIIQKLNICNSFTTNYEKIRVNQGEPQNTKNICDI